MLSIKNFSSLITPKIFASKSGNVFVNLFNWIFAIGHFSSIAISNIFILPLAKGTLSNAPGASNFLCKDFATSNSGEIITSTGSSILL